MRESGRGHSMGEAKAIIVVQDAVLASSLELALLAAGLAPVVCEPPEDPARLPLETAAVLILGPCRRADELVAFVSAARAGGWRGLVVLIAGDGGKLRAAFRGAERVAVLEMPFVAADLLAAIRVGRPPGDAPD
jgi:hypothetical protein